MPIIYSNRVFSLNPNSVFTLNASNNLNNIFVSVKHGGKIGFVTCQSPYLKSGKKGNYDSRWK